MMEIFRQNRHLPKICVTAFIVAGLGLSGCSTTQSNPTGHSDARTAQQVNANATYNETDLVNAVSTHLGVTSESAASMIERLFHKQGRPVGYITGQEGSGAFIAGLRYGNGTLWMKDGRKQAVYWRGPSIGWDWGGNASKVFTLVYNLKNPDYIYRRFPGVDGSAYVVAGMGVNYQRANGITLAPIRTGVGARLGANIGYLSYKRKKGIWPF
ncbi:MAG: DUF1134 domain-containing protein [Robiginitomaculum sp.]